MTARWQLICLRLLPWHLCQLLYMLIYVNDISDASLKYYASGVLCRFCFFLNRIVEADQQYDFFKFGGVLSSVFPREPHVHLTQMIHLVWRPSCLWAFFLWIVCRVTRGSFQINTFAKALYRFSCHFSFSAQNTDFSNQIQTKQRQLLSSIHVNKYIYLFTQWLSNNTNWLPYFWS